MAAGHLALLCLGLCLLIANVSSQRRCSVPVWRPELGDNPITANRGKVLLVALLRGYCNYCAGQAGRLEVLKNRLASQGFPNIAMIIINGGETISRNNVHNLQSASNLPVLQDTANHVMFHQIFRGNKDDFVVYDKCGQRVAYIPHPYSNLDSNITERVLKTVHNGRHSCHCRLDRIISNPGDVMYGDQPGEQPTYTVTNNNLALDCPPNDTLCREYERSNRRNNLEPVISSQQGWRGSRSRSRAHQGETGGGQVRGVRNRNNQRNRQNYGHRHNGRARTRTNGVAA